jgi:hypothetical protein
VKDARKEVLHSLVRRREAEENAEGCTLEIQRLQLANEVILKTHYVFSLASSWILVKGLRNDGIVLLM